MTRKSKKNRGVQSIRYGGGTITQVGRYIAFERNNNEAERMAAANAYIAHARENQAAQQQRHARLLALMQEIGPFRLVAQAGATYLTFDPNTYKEWADDRHSAHIEYLALQALAVPHNYLDSVDPLRATEVVGEAIELVREMFVAASTTIVSQYMEESLQAEVMDPAREHIVKARAESLVVRNAAYDEHVRRVLIGTMDALDAELRQVIGYSAADALEILATVPRILDERLVPRIQQSIHAVDILIRQLKRERRGRAKVSSMPDWLLDAPYSDATNYVTLIATVGIFDDAEELMAVSAAQVAAAAKLDESVCTAFLDSLSCTRDMYIAAHHMLPSGAHPMTKRPLLKTKNGYLVPVPTSVLEAVRPCMEDELENLGSKSLKERYRKRRADFVEIEATRILESALPKSSSWTNLDWASAESEGELDGLVHSDMMSFRLQCKAGRVTAPARRGAPERMATDLGKLIVEAADQHAALASAMGQTTAEQLGFTPEQAQALTSPIQIEVIVTLDDVTIWSTEAHKLKEIGAFSKNTGIPWVVSLTDLMAVADLLDGSQLAHYIVRRQRLERLGHVSAHDELDWVGHYIYEGLFFDDKIGGRDQPDAFLLHTYTEQIDSWYFARAGARTVPTPKPQQELSEPLKALLRRLEHAAPKRWLAAALCLLEGGEYSRAQWSKMIDHAYSRAKITGSSNASQVFLSQYGLTIFIVRSAQGYEATARGVRYAEYKMKELKVPYWIAICEGADERVSVVVVGEGNERGLAGVLLGSDRPR